MHQFNGNADNYDVILTSRINHDNNDNGTYDNDSDKNYNNSIIKMMVMTMMIIPRAGMVILAMMLRMRMTWILT